MPMLKRGETYEEVYAALKWDIPRSYNMAFDICDRHAAEPGRTALIYFDERGHEHRYAFSEIRDIANKLANALTALGAEPVNRWKDAITMRSPGGHLLCVVPVHSDPETFARTAHTWP